MKWSSGIQIFSLLALMPTYESAHQKLNFLNDLKKIDFGQSVPKHSLLLLHWFANVIDMDNNDVLLLTFDPNTEDFGSHHYGNYEDMLDPLPRGYRYYTVGNLHKDTSNELPAYVRRPPVREYEGSNMDRIIFRVQERNSRGHRIDRVYLTQHYRQHEHQGTRYNPEHTYQISPMLLQQMRLFSVENNPRTLQELRDMFESDAEDSQLRDISNTWGEKLMCLGLLLFIVIQEKYSAIMRPHQQQSDQNNPKPEEEDDAVAQSQFESNDSNEVNLLVWSHKESLNLTDKNEWHQSEQNGTLVPITKDHRNQRAEETRGHCMATEVYEETAADTSELQDDDQQKCLQDAPNDKYVQKPAGLICFVLIIFTTILFLLFSLVIVGLFSDIVSQQPHPGRVQIPGHNAHIELVAKQHKACARLYVKQDFRQWRSEFEQSWVGFYKSAERDTHQYDWGQWQWATKFTSCSDFEDYNGSCWEYCSGMEAASGVQARFILKHFREIARTPSFQNPD